LLFMAILFFIASEETKEKTHPPAASEAASEV
jgi:hypothetical protein